MKKTTKIPIKVFKVASDLNSFVENILTRRGIPFNTETEAGTISVPVSGEYFHKVIIRARCEKADFEKWGLIVDIPRIHISEINDPLVLDEIGTNCYQVVEAKREN